MERTTNGDTHKLNVLWGLQPFDHDDRVMRSDADAFLFESEAFLVPEVHSTQKDAFSGRGPLRNATPGTFLPLHRLKKEDISCVHRAPFIISCGTLFKNYFESVFLLSSSSSND